MSAKTPLLDVKMTGGLEGVVVAWGGVRHDQVRAGECPVFERSAYGKGNGAFQRSGTRPGPL